VNGLLHNFFDGVQGGASTSTGSTPIGPADPAIGVDRRLDRAGVAYPYSGSDSEAFRLSVLIGLMVSIGGSGSSAGRRAG
jgi:hypothetical protein